MFIANKVLIKNRPVAYKQRVQVKAICISVEVIVIEKRQR